MNDTIGQYIHKLRVENGFTLTQMGAIIGIDSGALSKIENGKKHLDQKCLPKIAEAFSLDLRNLKNEFLSEKIAIEIINSTCDDTILKLIEEKVKYFKIKNSKQSSIKF